MTIRHLIDPFHTVSQDNILLSDQPEIQALNQYAVDLEAQTADDFDLNQFTSEFVHNQLGFVRNGLLLAKIKFSKLYRDYGDGTFASFCREKLRKQRWQINDTIRAARVVIDLIYAGFEILPSNIAQAVTLAKLTGERLVEQWRNIINNIPLEKITAKSIRTFLVPPEKKENSLTTILVPKEIHANIEKEATARNLSIVKFLEVMVNFFINGGNSHLLQPETNMIDYRMNLAEKFSKEALHR